VVADFEAGLGTLSRLKAGYLDVLIVVAQPSAKALEAASRAEAMIREDSVGRVIIVANRVEGARDLERVHEAFPEREVVMVPDDRAIGAADARGAAPFDLTPDAPAVRVVRTLAESLMQ